MKGKLLLLPLGGLAMCAMGNLNAQDLGIYLHPKITQTQMSNPQPYKSANQIIHELNLDNLIEDFSYSFSFSTNPELNSIGRIHLKEGVNSDSVLTVLNGHSNVDVAEYVPVVTNFNDPEFRPNDIRANSQQGQWYLYQIDALKAWGVFQPERNPNIKIAIVDDGFDVTHNDLKDAWWKNEKEIPDNGIDDDGNGLVDDYLGYNFGDNNSDVSVKPNTNCGHGTMVAGNAGAISNNNTGIASIGYNLNLIPIKIGAGSSCALYGGAEGMAYAVAMGADIMNCSFGGYGNSEIYGKITRDAERNGTLIVAAAGNDNVSERSFPAALPSVISVAATNIRNEKAGFSNYGTQVNVSAPGEGILTTANGNRTTITQGTSFSSPIVAGLLGLMKTYHPGATNDQLKNCLYTTVDPIANVSTEHEGKLGVGRINAFKAMKCMESLKTNVVDINANNKTINIYPNPLMSNFVNIEFKDAVIGEQKIGIYNINGQLIESISTQIDHPNQTIQLSINAPAGVYLIQGQNATNKFVERLVKY